METLTNVLPAGEYLIIDPCYVYHQEDRWEALVNCMYANPTYPIAADPQTDVPFAYSFTATGDGTYADQEGHLYGVDSGKLACLPLAMIDAVTLMQLAEHDHSHDHSCHGRFVTFADPWSCTPCDQEGVIRFGHIAIDTGPTWEALRLMDDEVEPF